MKSVAPGALQADGIHELGYSVGKVGQLGIRVIERVRVSIAGGVGCNTGELFAPLQHQPLILRT
jgi:hypothetical protein